MMKNKKPIKLFCSGLFLFGVITFFTFAPSIDFRVMGTAIKHFVSPDLTGYPYQNPPIFFSIGEAIASIAILLAIYQLKKDKWLLALKIRNYIEPTIFTTITMGVVLTIISPFIIIKDPANIFQISIFWQVVGSIFVAFSIALLFIKATNKNLFNERNAREFYEVMAWELSRPSPERLEVILKAFIDNLDNICNAAALTDQSQSRESAILILDVVLSEGSLVDLLTTKRLDALHYFIIMAEKYNLDNQKMRGLSPVVKNLFFDQGSFLYKHLEMSGLALASNLYESLFGSPKMLRNFDFFGWSTIHGTTPELTNTQIKVFIKALSTAMETYLKDGSVPPRHINNGISYLSTIFNNLCSKIRKEEDRGVDTKYHLEDEWWSLHTIANFFGHDYPFLAYEENLNDKIIEVEKTAHEADFYSDFTINAGIAAALYKSFVHLSYIKDTNDTYHIVLELLNGLMYAGQYKQGYRTPFEKRMWEQIAKNVIEKCYPNVLKGYLHFTGFTLASPEVGKREGWIIEQAERMRRLLYIDLKPLLDRDEKMVNDKKMIDVLLPQNMKYENGKFTYTIGFGKGPTVEILEPPSESSSALEDVDLESGSLL